jgi:hypothetical protein
VSQKTNLSFNYKQVSRNGDVEIFAGKNAGKRILKDLFATENEITIISPIVDEIRVSDLFVLARKGMKVNLAFDTLHARGRNNILQKLIVQEVETDMEAILDKASSKRWLNLLVVVFALIGVSGLGYCAYDFNQNPEGGINMIHIAIGVIGFLIAMILEVMRQLVIRRKVNKYTYVERINFKYFKNNLKEKYLTSRLVIIDNKVAYLTSMDFVRESYDDRYEHWTRITNQEEIASLKAYANGIFESDNKLNTHQTSWLSKKLYTEPQ